MKASEDANSLKELIEKAIEDNKLSRTEYDMIISKAFEDGIVDPQEQALLSQLQDMIENKTIKLVP